MSFRKFIPNRSSHRRHTWNPILRLLSFLTNIVAPSLSPTADGYSPLTRIDGLIEDSESLMGEGCIRVQKKSGKERGEVLMAVTIDILPDDVLLEVFSFYQDASIDVPSYQAWKWRTLVHVCRRWRSIVFASPRRLDLRILCTSYTRVKMLDVWPILPMEICCCWYSLAVLLQHKGVDNIVAALEYNDRVCRIKLDGFPSWLFDSVTAAMEKPFPVLTHLSILSLDKAWPPAIPAAFLGGSAPRLRSCIIGGLEFPGIWKLLSTANRLVILHLRGIPPSAYVSPEAIVTLISTMPNLEQLWLLFLESHWLVTLVQATQLPPQPMRVVLPALTRFWFHGDSEYIEDMCPRLDAPRLDDFRFSFFHKKDDTPQIRDFLNRTKLPKTYDGNPLDYYAGPW